MSWTDVGPLDSPQYQELSSITRSLHLRDAMRCFGKESLPSHKIETRNAKVNAKVLWFAPTKPMNQNNMYGNVSFTLDWNRALNELGPHLYYIDQKRTHDIVYSRVLLSNKLYRNLDHVNTNDFGMPLAKLRGKYNVATACDGVKHVVEIGIEADAPRGKWLYANCKIQANDHSSANKSLYQGGPYNPCICHRFNYFDKVCPSPYPAYRTKQILSKKCPTMLRDAPTPSSDLSIVQVTSAIAQMLSLSEEDDEPEYEDGEYIANYDDHDKGILQSFGLESANLGASSDDSSYYRTGSYGAGSSYGSGAHGWSQTGHDESYGNSRASGFQQTTARQQQDEGWSTGGKVALVAGGLALFAGLAAAFSADGEGEDKKKKTKNWLE